MSWFVKLITNIDLLVKSIQKVKKWYVEAKRAWKAKRIRSAVDNGDDAAIHGVVSDIVKKRQERMDKG